MKATIYEKKHFPQESEIDDIPVRYALRKHLTCLPLSRTQLSTSQDSCVHIHTHTYNCTANKENKNNVQYLYFGTYCTVEFKKKLFALNQDWELAHRFLSKLLVFL